MARYAKGIVTIQKLLSELKTAAFDCARLKSYDQMETLYCGVESVYNITYSSLVTGRINRDSESFWAHLVENGLMTELYKLTAVFTSEQHKAHPSVFALLKVREQILVAYHQEVYPGLRRYLQSRLTTQAQFKSGRELVRLSFESSLPTGCMEKKI